MAAMLIQKNFRGFLVREQLKFSLFNKLKSKIVALGSHESPNAKVDLAIKSTGDYVCSVFVKKKFSNGLQ